MMPINNSPLASQSVGSDTTGTERLTRLNLSGYGLSGSTQVREQDRHEILSILANNFDGMNAANLKTALTDAQKDGLSRLNVLGAISNGTLHKILDRNLEAPRTTPAPSRAYQGAHSECSSASHNVPASDRSFDEELDRTERGAMPRNAGAPARVADDDSEPGKGFFGTMRAAGRAVGNALPESTPLVLGTVAGVLASLKSGLALKAAIKKYGMPSHDTIELVGAVALPVAVVCSAAAVAVLSIKSGTDGQRD